MIYKGFEGVPVLVLEATNYSTTSLCGHLNIVDTSAQSWIFQVISNNSSLCHVDTLIRIGDSMFLK
jgi:hypothetical protein